MMYHIFKQVPSLIKVSVNWGKKLLLVCNSLARLVCLYSAPLLQNLRIWKGKTKQPNPSVEPSLVRTTSEYVFSLTLKLFHF